MFWDRFVDLCNENETKPTPAGIELGISSSAVSKWRNGTMPNADALIKIADKFNVSVDYLLCRENNTHVNTECTLVHDINEQKLLEKFRLLTYEQQIRVISDVIKETENNSEEQQ